RVMVQTIKTAQVVYEGRHEVLVATVVDDHGDAFRREIVVRGDAACVLPYDPDRRMALMVRLPRTPAQFIAGLANVLEAPAGVIEDGGAAAPCTRRGAWQRGRRRRPASSRTARRPTPASGARRWRKPACG